MEFNTYCLPDKKVVVVTKRETGEECSKVRQVSSGRVLSDEKTGPDNDQVRELT